MTASTPLVRSRPFAAAAILVAAATMLGGCNNQKQNRLELLEMENADLRDRNAQLELALDQSETQRLSLEEQLSGMSARQATGFEDIAGVESSAFATGEVLVNVASDLLFDSGKATLKQSAKSTLDRVASVLNSQYGGRMIRVAGHTDSDPIRKSAWKTNERLSSERALAVEEYLASKGVDNNRMYVAAFGSTFPKGSKPQSRRVEILVLSSSAPN